MASIVNEILPWKVQYYEELEQAAKFKPQKQLMTRRWVNMMSLKIELAKKLVQNEGEEKLHSTVKEALNTYDLVTVNQIPKLVWIDKQLRQERVIVALGESFEIVHKSHLLTSHGGVDEMADWLAKSKFLVASICLPIMVQSCSVCRSGTSPGTIVKKQKKYNYIGYVDIVDMSIRKTKGTNRFEFLLVFQDETTKFVQLRPISAEDLHDSIANELTPLFSDIGPPACIMVKPSLLKVFERLLEERLNVIFRPKIDLAVSDAGDLQVAKEAQVALADWLEKEPQGKWCVGCFIVQWELNNMIQEDNTSPFNNMRSPITYNEPVNQELPDSNAEAMETNRT